MPRGDRVFERVRAREDEGVGRGEGAVEPQRQRHVLREEVTQSLGLGQDSDRYEDSIFRNSPSLVTEFSSIDREIIALLYDPGLKSGFTSADVLGAVRVR